MLAHGDMAATVGNTLAFVAQNATLADAKKRMEAVKGCQDVFVTSDGQPKSPFVGWITNVEISKRARA